MDSMRIKINTEDNDDDIYDDGFYDDYDDDDLLEDDILEVTHDDFSEKIRERGEEYYIDDKVIRCIKSNHEYYAQVEGTSIYNTEVKIEDGDVIYYCDCPCKYPCKHIYATLLAIYNEDYDEVELKEELFPKKVDYKELLESLPADELKDFIINNNPEDMKFDVIALRNTFITYFPKQTYEYYYNTMYNSFITKKNVIRNKIVFLDEIDAYLEHKDYDQSLLMIKALINAYIDTNEMNNPKKALNSIPILGTYLRTTYRNADDKIKNEIDKWQEQLKEKDYYNNLYIKDLFLTIEDCK